MEGAFLSSYEGFSPWLLLNEWSHWSLNLLLLLTKCLILNLLSRTYQQGLQFSCLQFFRTTLSWVFCLLVSISVLPILHTVVLTLTNHSSYIHCYRTLSWIACLHPRESDAVFLLILPAIDTIHQLTFISSECSWTCIYFQVGPRN